MAYRHEPTIGLLELSSVARGVEVVDSLLKEATIRVMFARPVSPGKYLAAFTGSVDDVAAALRRGVEVGRGAVVDQLFLPAVHPQVIAALARPVRVPELDAVGVVETFTAAAALLAADAAGKRAAVDLVEIRLAQGLGGKAFFTLTGPVADVEAAVAAAAEQVEPRGLLLARVVIPRPHERMRDLLGRHDEALGG